MIPVSSRYTRPICFSFLPVLAVVVVHSYVGIRSDDCPGSAAVSAELAAGGSPSSPGMRSVFDAFDWHDGTLAVPQTSSHLKFAVVRSYDPKKLYHHPEVAFVREAAATGRGLDWVTVDGENLPIHRAYYSVKQPAIFVAYVLMYRSQPVSNPYWTQLRSFPAELLTGQRPMTLFFISGTSPESDSEAMQKRAVEWLASSWRKHRASCQ